MKSLILIICILIFPVYSMGQLTMNESEAKTILFSHMNELTKYEGIYKFSEVVLSVKDKQLHTDISIFEKVAVIKIKQEFKVFSLKSHTEIGKIDLSSDNDYYGDLIPNQFSDYPVMKTAPNQWYTEIEYGQDNYKFTNFKLIKEIKEIQKSCSCKIKVSFILEKTFPNSDESPATLAKTGTGVIISSQGHVITNRHIVEQLDYRFESSPVEKWILESDNYDKIDIFKIKKISTSIRTILNGTEYDLVPVLMIDSTLNGNILDLKEDLIILKITNPPKNLSYAVLNNKPCEYGNEVYSLSFPLNAKLDSRLIISKGNLSSHTFNIDSYIFNSNIGSFGGGIFDKQTGNLVGILTSRNNNNLLGNQSQHIYISTNLFNLIYSVRDNPTGFFDLEKSLNNHKKYHFWESNNKKQIWDINKKYPIYNKIQFSIFVRSGNNNESITLLNNRNSTIQIISN